jgi:hypothetical protein
VKDEGVSGAHRSGGNATVGDTIISINDIRLDRVLGSGQNGFVFAGEEPCSSGELPSRYGRHALIVPGKIVQHKRLLKHRSLRC